MKKTNKQTVHATETNATTPPLTAQELDAIFNPAGDRKEETTTVGRSYGWNSPGPTPG